MWHLRDQNHMCNFVFNFPGSVIVMQTVIMASWNLSVSFLKLVYKEFKTFFKGIKCFFNLFWNMRLHKWGAMNIFKWALLKWAEVISEDMK